MAAGKVVFWDFDGTLACRPGMWRGCMVETLDLHERGHGVQAEQLAPYLRDRFPWHRPDIAHPELATPKAWWEPIEALMAQAYVGVGCSQTRATELARLAHERYVDCAHGWRLFDDTLAVLNRLASRGWSHVVLSNHVPELLTLVQGLGLGNLVDLVLSSALTGYEKPHPNAFAIAIQACGHPELCWMVGDNPVADVAGAEAAGLPAILARTGNASTFRHAADLHEAQRVIENHHPSMLSGRQGAFWRRRAPQPDL